MAMNYPMPTQTANVHSTATEAEHSNIESFLTVEQFEQLRSIMIPMKAATTSHLFWEGDPTANLYYIQKGKVKLRKSTEEGREFIFSILQAGDLICETLDGSVVHHSYTAEVIEHAEIGVIGWNELEGLLKQNGDMAIRFMSWMTLSHRITQSKFRDLLLFGKPGALASTLIRLSNSYGVLTPTGIRIDLKLTNAELADFIGTTRESVNRLLHSFKEDGIIEMISGKITIIKLDALRGVCQCPTCPACSKSVCRI
ncbi:MAG: Crp/Fnr family transcriptional regulator [Candidatus Cohnella colombiensis]|uniref:Crp/Fnr family transcriptional regulator n=1 Tax=Candidatus Cohnella colombiensis TaxID=3121368 RepID=A0AA95EXY3_9BACL|nr:MAG: Crp/Fnr family transcriptional regulator [Cohnella sp.]